MFLNNDHYIYDDNDSTHFLFPYVILSAPYCQIHTRVEI